MKRSRFSDEQIIGLLKEHQAGLSTTELCRKCGVSDATFYKWRSKYGGMDVSEAKRLRGVAAERASASAIAGCGDPISVSVTSRRRCPRLYRSKLTASTACSHTATPPRFGRSPRICLPRHKPHAMLRKLLLHLWCRTCLRTRPLRKPTTQL